MFAILKKYCFGFCQISWVQHVFHFSANLSAYIYKVTTKDSAHKPLFKFNLPKSNHLSGSCLADEVRHDSRKAATNHSPMLSGILLILVLMQAHMLD